MVRSRNYEDGVAFKKQHQALAEALASFRNSEDCERFLECLLSPHEFDVISQRLAIAKELVRGKRYYDVVNEIKTSSATVGKVKQVLRYGEDSHFYENVLVELLKN